MKKIYYLVVAAFFCAFITACHYDGDTIINKVEEQTPTFDVVIETLIPKENVEIVGVGEKVTLYFREGKEDIPYVCMTNESIGAYLNNGYTISDVNADTKQVAITNTARGNTKAIFDLTKHTLAFENYDQFFQKPDSVYMDPAAVANAEDAEGGPSYLRINQERTSYIAGQPVALGWYTQDVGVILSKNSDGTYNLAIPLQMLNDIFLSPSLYHFVYNGVKLYPSAYINPTSDYYTTSIYAGESRSAAMAELCYNELCMNLDFNYGLKAIHGIDKFPDFDSYFVSAGIKKKLMSTDTKTFANALKDVCEFYFGDGHSNYMFNSPYLGTEYRPTGYHKSPIGEKFKENGIKYANARQPVATGDISGYTVSEDGKTAIVRFDEFTNNSNAKTKASKKSLGNELISLLNKYVTYEDEKRTKHKYENIYDTVSFIYAVNEQVQADPNIENIVLDLSNNGGGANHSACFVLAWMLGKCDFDFTNPITGAKWSIGYEADVNMNGTFDEAADTVKDKNLFCLISPCSFSCGNMVPAMLKASDRVTILGVTSSGGSSCVQPSSAADGTIFRMSSKYVMSVNKNGSYYDIDRGVDPHYYINNPENFYNTDTISELVNNINSGTLGVSTSSNP
ncbi:Periplasmic protease [Treponema sp. JC4]|uniref:S41 family peptidase n=1 Tax=Treponema sp. JC4 TaxID=1124982 RepID=UPI00025B02A6|nr:S41 family peptidase [Treponema sp. JC4]EID85503.1 Periplasmic protease [Treponema sp. JC4]